jgi:L-seryl-tRNA(Ser) seleniumtransferase
MAASTGAAKGGDGHEALRSLPAVDRLAAELDGPRHLAVAAARIEIEALRLQLVAGTAVSVDGDRLRAAATELVRLLARGSLRPVLNATGVILHTNLGRAPLAPAAAAAAASVAASYSNLELSLADGARGSRHDHVEPLLAELTGADAAFAVNNNAAAVLLALAALAGGGEVVVGRDQLVEIGGSFRIPEIVAGAGVRLVEVGTTNRTRTGDYEAAIGTGTAALMRVHQSNFRTVGFVTTPPLAELAGLAADRGLPLVDDLGSGAVEAIGDEPVIADSIAAGAIACCSADKLLGGPQAGIIAGSAAAVERCRRHPLARALRLDKLQLAALEATLRLRRDLGPEALPAAAMLAAGEAELGRRAELIAAAIGTAATIEPGTARMGGGTLPETELPGPVCAVTPGAGGADRLAAGLRRGEPAVIARVEGGRVLLDPRTLSDAEAALAGEAVRAALA